MGNDDDVSTLIRPATPADADAIAHVHTVSWRETYGRFVDDPDTSLWFDVGRRVDMWRSTLASPDVEGSSRSPSTAPASWASPRRRRPPSRMPSAPRS